jgi:hypothetical protein
MTARHRRLAHSLEDEARGAARWRQAVPYRESQRRVAVEAIADFIGLLAIIPALIVLALLVAGLGRLFVATLPWSAIYAGVILTGAWGLCRAASWGDR